MKGPLRLISITCAHSSSEICANHGATGSLRLGEIAALFTRIASRLNAAEMTRAIVSTPSRSVLRSSRLPVGATTLLPAHHPLQ
jgi:hypothetical protein